MESAGEDIISLLGKINTKTFSMTFQSFGFAEHKPAPSNRENLLRRHQKSKGALWLSLVHEFQTRQQFGFN